MSDPTSTARPPRTKRGGRARHAQGVRVLLSPPRISAALAVAAGLALVSLGAVELTTPPSRSPAHIAVGSLPVRSGADSSAADHESAAPPVHISIPALRLEEPLIDLRVQQDGSLGVPKDANDIGWWSEGPRPGEPGAAIIVGHVDSATGSGAFHGLSTLRPGNKIAFTRDDKSTVTFTVQALREYEKDSLPEGQVYASSGPPALRLITCSGTYNRDQGGYQDNLVVYATLTDK